MTQGQRKVIVGKHWANIVFTEDPYLPDPERFRVLILDPSRDPVIRYSLRSTTYAEQGIEVFDHRQTFVRPLLEALGPDVAMAQAGNKIRAHVLRRAVSPVRHLLNGPANIHVVRREDGSLFLNIYNVTSFDQETDAICYYAPHTTYFRGMPLLYLGVEGEQPFLFVTDHMHPIVTWVHYGGSERRMILLGAERHMYPEGKVDHKLVTRFLNSGTFPGLAEDR